MLKRACHGVCHQMSQKHLQRYVNEFAGRINIRDKDTNDQRSPCLCDLVGRRLNVHRPDCANDRWSRVAA